MRALKAGLLFGLVVCHTRDPRFRADYHLRAEFNLGQDAVPEQVSVVRKKSQRPEVSTRAGVPAAFAPGDLLEKTHVRYELAPGAPGAGPNLYYLDLPSGLDPVAPRFSAYFDVQFAKGDHGGWRMKLSCERQRSFIDFPGESR